MPEKAASIEAEIGAALRAEDLKPTFYIAVNENNKPIGLALLVNIKGPNGVISGGVGLDTKGKVVKVEIHKHSESAGISDAKFLKQFVGKGIDDQFKIDEDVEPLAGAPAASQAVALLPKKTLAISYALFLKRPEKAEEDASEMIEPEDLKEVMMMMKDEYDLIRAYFQKGQNQRIMIKRRQCRQQNGFGSTPNSSTILNHRKTQTARRSMPTFRNSSRLLSKNLLKPLKQKEFLRKLKSNGRVSSI